MKGYARKEGEWINRGSGCLEYGDYNVISESILTDTGEVMLGWGCYYRMRPIGRRVYVYDVVRDMKYLGNCASLEAAKELCYDNATDPSVWEPGMGDV